MNVHTEWIQKVRRLVVSADYPGGALWRAWIHLMENKIPT